MHAVQVYSTVLSVTQRAIAWLMKLFLASADSFYSSFLITNVDIDISELLKPQVKDITIHIKPTHKKMGRTQNWRKFRKYTEMCILMQNNDLTIMTL